MLSGEGWGGRHESPGKLPEDLVPVEGFMQEQSSKKQKKKKGEEKRRR